MKPILFSLGPLHLYSFGLLVALGVLVSLCLMQRRACRDGFPSVNDVSDLVFTVILFGFTGARLFYVLENFQWYLQNPLSILAVWQGGFIFYGGVAGSFLAFWVVVRRKGIPFLKGLDFILPYIALTHAFGRIGCFLNGCCGGRICGLPWAVRFPGKPQAEHPAQLYEAVFDFALFFFLSRRCGRKRFDGEVTGWYFLFYPLGRFVIEFFREAGPGWAGLTWNQWVSLLIFLAAAIFLKGVRRFFPKSV